ncbi:MAG TPA: DMT family transporter [Stellaceae bacterium]|nr:DMT family transporter [Stellaceae bacterium]
MTEAHLTLEQAAGRRVLRGILLMCLGVCMFPFLNTSAKLLTADYPITEIVWARFTGHLVCVLITFMPQRGWRIFAAHRPVVQISRSFLLLASTSLFVSAIGHLPLATASAIGFTSPFIVTALSVPMLREPVGPRRWAAVGIGFIGALIVIRPHASPDSWAALLVLGSACCYGLYQVLTRKGGAHDNAATAIVYAALVGTVVMSVIVPFHFRLPFRAVDWVLFAALGIFGGFGHYFVVRGFQNASAAIIAPFGYIELVGATLLGYVVFGNFPDGWTWVGAAIIVACGVYVAYRERQRRTPS